MDQSDVFLWEDIKEQSEENRADDVTYDLLPCSVARIHFTVFEDPLSFRVSYQGVNRKCLDIICLAHPFILSYG